VDNLDKPVSQPQTEIHVMDDKDTMKESEQEIAVEMTMSRRGRSPTRKTNLSRAKEPVIIQEEKIDEYDNSRSDTNLKQEARVESARSNSSNILAPCQDRRGRSPSPMWVPGSTSYADILRGRMQVQMNIAPMEPPRQEMIPLSEESHQDLSQVPHAEQVATNETQPIAEMQQIESTQEMEDVPIEDIQITEVYCQPPEISTEKIEEEQGYDKPASTNWTDEALEDYNVLQHVEPYENVQPQSVEIYDYIIPEPMPELVNFIGSQLGTYPVSAYVYAPSAHQQLEVQQLDAMNLNSYNASLAYSSEHYVSQAAYLPTRDVYQQNSMQQQSHCLSSDMKHTTPILVEDTEKQILPIQQSNIIKDIVIESDDKPEQEESVDVSIVEASRIPSKMEEKDVQGKGTLNNIETKGQTFSYAQILSQGLNSRVTPTRIDKSPAASHQSKERSNSPKDTLSSCELSLLSESKIEQDSQLSIAKVEQPKQFKQNNWDTMKKREVKKRQQQIDDKSKQTDEKKSRKPIDKPKEKQKKEKLSPQLTETRKETVIEKISDSSTKKEEKSVQEKQTLDSIETNLPQEKKRKQKKKKVNKLEGDEIDKALKEIEDMDKQKAKSQKDKFKEQNKDQNKSRDSSKTEETWEKSKNEIDKKQNTCSVPKSKQSEKSKEMTKMQDRLANQTKVKDQDMPEDNTEFKVFMKETLKDQSHIMDDNVHTIFEKSDVKVKRKNKVNKNTKRQTEENLENKIQLQLDTSTGNSTSIGTSSSAKKDIVNIMDESNTTEIVNSLVAQKTKSEDMNEKTIVPIKIESTKKHEDTAKEENNETKEIIENKPVESIELSKEAKKEIKKIIKNKPIESIKSLKEDKNEIKKIIEDKPVEFTESPRKGKNETKKLIESKPAESIKSPKKDKNRTKKIIEDKPVESIESPKEEKKESKKIIEDKPVESIESSKEERKENKKIIEDKPIQSIESLKKEKNETKQLIEDKPIESIKSPKKEKNKIKKIIEDKPVESIESSKEEKKEIKKIVENKSVESIDSKEERNESKKIIETKSVEFIESSKKDKNETKKAIETKSIESIKTTKKEKETKKIIEDKPIESIKLPKKEKNKTKKIIDNKPVESIESSKEEKKEIKKIIKNKSVESIDSPKEEKNEIKEIIENKSVESIDSSKEDKNETKKTIETKAVEFIESSKEGKNNIEKLIENKPIEPIGSIESPIDDKIEDAKSSIFNKIDNKIDNNIKDKPKSRKKDKTSKSKIKIDNTIDLTIKKVQQPSEKIKIEIKSDTKDSKDSTDSQIYKEHKKEKYDDDNDNLKSEQLSSTGKALIIEKRVTTITTTTAIPGSAEIKPPDVKSIKSVEILENIPLPKIVGSKVTELISLRPGTVEASLTTTYARISNDSPVDSCPVQTGQAITNPQEIDLTSSIISTENIVTSHESSLFGSVQDRRTCDVLESRDASAKSHDMPINFIFEEKKEEPVLDTDNNIKEQTVLLNESIIEQKDKLKATTYEETNRNSDTKEKEISAINTSLQDDNTIESQEINNSIEKDNIALTGISQVAANISIIEKEEQINECTTDKVKAEDVLKSENKEQTVPSHLLELVKPYALDRHVYNLAESNFYRYFKTVKVVEVPQLPAVIQTRPESIERIVQESVMRPIERTNQETFNADNRRHALMIDAPKYPIINFYELESQWVIAKSSSERSRSVLSDDSEISIDSVIEKVERKVEEEACIIPLKEDAIEVDNKPIITETNENLMSCVPQITTIAKVQVSENICKLLTNENETGKPANVQQSIHPVSYDLWMNLDEPIVIENNFNITPNLWIQEIKEIVSEKSITEKSEKTENEEIKKEEVMTENYERKIESEETKMEEQIEKETENKRTKCKKRENMIQKAEVKIEGKETETRETTIEKRENEVSNSTEIAVKDEYHGGIKNIQNEILCIDNKEKQGDKTKNQPKRKKESKHFKDAKIKDMKSKAESKNRTNEETKTDIVESDLPAMRSNLDKYKISENETNSSTLQTEKSPKDNAELNLFPESISKPKDQEATDVVQQKLLPKHEEHKTKSGKKSKKQNEKSEIQERSPTKRECKIKQDDNIISSKATESSIESSISEALPIVQKQQDSKDDLPKFDSRLNPNAKSWAAIVGTKGVTEVITVIPSKNDSLSIPSDRPSAIVCQNVTDSVADITQELQTPIVNISCEIPPKQETSVQHSLPSEQQINKFINNEESKAIPTDEKLITKKSIDPPKQFKEGNKSYAEVAASFRHASSQASAQEEIYLAKSILLKSNEIIDTSALVHSVEDPDTEKSQSSLEQDNKQNNEVVMQVSSEESLETIIATPVPQKESISWIEEVEKETSSDVFLDISDAKDKEANVKTEICTWAAIVGKKSVETSEVNIPNLEQNLCKSDQVVEQRPPLPIQIYVEKTPDQEPIENLVQVDEQGFMEFVNRKELRHRRSRSRSRSARRDDGHTIVENTDSIENKEIKTLNAEIRGEDVRDKEEIENEIEQLPQKDEDIENNESVKTIKKDIVQETIKPSEKIDISKNKDRSKQKKDKEIKKQFTQSETQNAESKVAQGTKSEQGETPKGRRNKSKKSKTSKDQTKQQAEINEEKESKYVGESKGEQESADKNDTCNKVQPETPVIENREMQSIVDQPIKETQLIIDTANTQEDKSTYVETHPLTEQNNMTKSKKKSKNKKGKVVSEQVTENISDTEKKVVILRDSEEKIESTKEPKLEDVMEIKLEEAIAADICNASASSKNKEIPTEENNKQEDVKQQIALDKIIEMESIVQKAITDEQKNTESACKESEKTEENVIEQSEVCKITKAEKRKQKKKAKALSRNGVTEKEEHVEDVAQNKSDLSVYDASYGENIRAEEMIKVTEKSVTETKESEKYKELDLFASSVEKKEEIDEKSIKIKDLPSVEKKHKQKQKSSKKQNAKIDSKKESPHQKDEIRFTKPDDITVKAVDEAINLTDKVIDSNAELDFNSSKNEENILSIEIESEEITETFDEKRKDEIKHEDEKQIETPRILEDDDAVKSIIGSEDTETTSLTTKEQFVNTEEVIVYDHNAISSTAVAKQTKSQIEEYQSDNTPQLCDVIVDNNIIKIESALTSDNVEMNKSADKIVTDTANAINAPQIDTSDVFINKVTELSPPLDESPSVTQQSVEDETKHVASIEQESADLPVKFPKVQFYIADEILVLSPENRRKDVPATSLLQEQVATDLDNSRFLSIDCGFWLDKRSYHEAERDHFENLALHMNASRGSKHDNRDRSHDRDDDRDGDNSGGGTGGKPRDSHGDSRSFPGAPQTERMIADLPGGICSWSDYSTYLSSESERTPDRSLSLDAIENTRLDSALSLNYSLPSDIQSPFDLPSLSPPLVRDPQTESYAESVVDAEVTPRERSVISSSDLQSPDCPSTCIRPPTFHLRPQSKLHLGRESREGSVQRCSLNREMERETAEGEAERRIRRIQVRSSSQPMLDLVLVRV